MDFETYTYRTKIQIGEKEIDRLWTLRKNTQDEFIVKEVYEDNCYKLPDDLSGKVIVDIGANIGAFAAACVDRGSKAIYCFDPFVSPATKLFPACVILEPYIVGNRATGRVSVSSLEKSDEGIYFTGGFNTFGKNDGTNETKVTISIESIVSDIQITFPDLPIWIKLDCEGSEYEILSSDLPWERIERIFGECHTLIDDKLSRDTAPIENGRFPIEPNILSLVGRLESVGYKVKIVPNGDDRHLHLFWAESKKAIFERVVDRSPANERDAERLRMLRDKDTIQPDSEYGFYDTHGSLGSISKAMEYVENLDVEGMTKEIEKHNPWIAERVEREKENIYNKNEAAKRTIKTVCILTPFRNARKYLPLYFRQLTSLRDLLSKNGYSLRLVAAEGDSLDGTRERIIELNDVSLTMVDTTHGHMKWGSVEDPVRMRVMSEVMNKALDQVKESDDIVVWIMSDLEWKAETVLGLIDDLIADSETPYDIGIHAPFVYADKNRNYFWDTWAYRAGGKRFSIAKPFHSWLEEGSFFLDSAGTCLVMLGEVARKARASDNEAVSFCREVEKLGYKIVFNGNREVFHAPKLSCSILWISDAVCISGFSRVAHSLFPLLSEAGFDLEIIAQNYCGTPHNFPYLIWPANVNGDDSSGTLRMQNLLWSNRDKYDAIVVLDDPWNVPRIVKGIEAIKELDKDFSTPPVIAWVTVDGENTNQKDLYGTFPVPVTTFGLLEIQDMIFGNNIPVVPFGVDSLIFRSLDKLECRKLTCGDGLIIPYDSFIVGTVSSNQLRKNLHLVIESFSEWTHRYNRSDAYLYLCLGKEDSQTGCDIDSLARYYDLRGKVITNRSLLSDEMLAKVYNSFDVFISLSNEGFGLCALEAMSCGVPCVLADWSGYSSWVPNDAAIKIPCSHTQLTAPLNSLAYVVGGVADKSKVVMALQRLYMWPEMKEKLSVRGKEVAAEFTWKRTGDKLIDVLERVIEREAIQREEPENSRVFRCSYCNKETEQIIFSEGDLNECYECNSKLDKAEAEIEEWNSLPGAPF